MHVVGIFFIADPSETKDNNLHIIIGASIGGVVALILLILLIACCVRASGYVSTKYLLNHKVKMLNQVIIICCFLGLRSSYSNSTFYSTSPQY